MTDDVETRRRRAAYRACHRGTKEMDWILGRFADSALPAMAAESARAASSALLPLPDPDLQHMILTAETGARQEGSRNWSPRCARFMGWS